ncbi:hypothetical protein LPTSP4_34230 [Leptospira ryugenii]|uniref:DUF4334 domain-containing protein n=1 Tax=Leptospira ryugenii TaxID=1917863 RepID=A0A2P2E4S5_9LEPT|nr:DUF4334 domain-containing protein [Leptospira ryugenii]GBF51885.1 hypothetical protein LPTSP4_34230 [Leptospira ryugenii]
MKDLETKFQAMRKSINTTEEAFRLYDALPVVQIEEMMGMWKGSGFPTGHTMDGALETFNWYGKEFEDADHVHPLVFRSLFGTLFKVNPALMPVRLATLIPSKPFGFLKYIFLPLRFFFQAWSSKARVRLTEFRGKVTATMVYDQLPIHDVFRRVNDKTLLGCMDYKGMGQFFFFVLEKVEP